MLEKTLESHLDCKEIHPVHPKGDQSWVQYFGHLMRRVDSLEKTLLLGAGGEGDDRGWDVWMASPTQWTWVWVNSGSWWWTGRPGMMRFMGSQRVRHDWATELNWTELNLNISVRYPNGGVEWTICSGKTEERYWFQRHPHTLNLGTKWGHPEHGAIEEGWECANSERPGGGGNWGKGDVEGTSSEVGGKQKESSQGL